MEKGTSVSCWEDRRFYFNRTKESIMKMIGKFIGGAERIQDICAFDGCCGTYRPVDADHL